jgi:hypothetical protein
MVIQCVKKTYISACKAPERGGAGWGEQQEVPKKKEKRSRRRMIIQERSCHGKK